MLVRGCGRARLVAAMLLLSSAVGGGYGGGTTSARITGLPRQRRATRFLLPRIRRRDPITKVRGCVRRVFFHRFPQHTHTHAHTHTTKPRGQD
uniref:Putative secreted protein n=1 Tax=Anopheles darlingi TaxID=43151 RepID=A0A2M4D5J1_ANODA